MSRAGFSYGLEHEWADVLRSAQIPSAVGKWNTEEDALVNSDGTSNDQLGDRSGFGGEINTTPTIGPSAQVEITKKLIEIFTSLGTPPSINYKCAMHVHVAYPGIREDLDKMKTLMRYVGKFQGEMLWTIFKLNPPRAQDYESPQDYDFAVEYFNKYMVPYRAHIYPQPVVEAALSAKTVEDFFDEIRPFEDEFGETNNPYINLSSIEKNGTIEFRPFTATTNLNQVRDALDWCGMFVEEAFGDQRNPLEFMAEQYFDFPEQKTIDPKLETAFRKDFVTNGTGYHAQKMRNGEEQWR